MRPVHVVGIGQLPDVLRDDARDEAEIVQAVVAAALADAGMVRSDVGFWCSGSSDYIMGKPFSFTTALDGIGPWPPVRESHVEMDGAWALYEAWVRLQHGDVDIAVAYGWGKSSLGPVDQVLTLQLDPYDVAPLGPSPAALAALQAQVLVDRGLADQESFAEVVERNHRAGRGVGRPAALTELDGRWTVRPLRRRDAAVRTDGAAALVLQVGGRGPRISGFTHICEPMELGLRDLGDSASARRAAELIARGGLRGVEVAELSTPFSPQEIVLTRALGLSGVRVNPSGGALCGDTPMVTGLNRIAEAARAVRAGASTALGHATAGPCLQHNLLCLLERA